MKRLLAILLAPALLLSNLPAQDEKPPANDDRAAAKEERRKKKKEWREKLQKALNPDDPGKDFVPFRGFGQAIDDTRIVGALMHRRDDLVAEDPEAWNNFDIEKAPATADLEAPIAGPDAKKRSIDELARATGIVVGGKDIDHSWNAGGVFVSADGLLLTNYHVAMDVAEPIAVMTTDGKLHRVVEVLAAHKEADVAIVRVEGNNFPFVRMAAEAPKGGDDLILLHHSEDRFYTVDRGYVRRHAIVGKSTYMEVSGEYATGGSGCGIFNKNHELVGLVSTMAMGTGPELAIPPSDEELSGGGGGGGGKGGGGDIWGDVVVIVRQASSWQSLRSLWKK